MPAFFIFTKVYYKLKKILLSFSSFYKADLRALALLRIGTALLVMTDLLIRGSDLTAHYTDAGIWPSELLHNFGWQHGFWTVHNQSGSYEWVFLLFCFHFLAATFLLFGYQTRIATVVTWLLTISLHNRNLFVLQSGDDLLRLMLLWGCFMPWHHYYSVDAFRKKIRKKRAALAYAGYLLLLSSVYFFSACLKTSAEWHGEGSAIYYALSLEQLRLPGMGDWLYQFPGLMKLLTWIIYYAELLIPLLILWPSKKGYTRIIAFFLIVFIHAGIGLTLYVGLFFIIGMVTAIGLLPGIVMDKLGKPTNLKTQKPDAKKKRRPCMTFVNGIGCLLIIAFCLVINLSSAKWFGYELRTELNYSVNALRLNQYWGMFSPEVMKKDGWLVYYGVDSLGRQWDLRRNEDYVDFAKPEHVVKMYKSDRWRKLAENMQDDRFTFLRPLYCKYILRKWNEEHPEKKILTLNLYFMEKRSLPGYKTTAVEKKLFCVCIHD
ncbi:MAG: HTTM domain-containing protein [Bacteroidota bacterium]